jgi:hypothetical protein
MLTDCTLVDLVPVQQIGRCTRLRRLKANGNRLIEVPATLSKCVLLDTIILSENKLTGLPAALGTLQGLTVLRLANNDLRTVPHELAAVTTLQEVDCSGNAKLDMIPLQLRGNTLTAVINVVLHSRFHRQCAYAVIAISVRCAERLECIANNMSGRFSHSSTQG